MTEQFSSESQMVPCTWEDEAVGLLDELRDMLRRWSGEGRDAELLAGLASLREQLIAAHPRSIDRLIKAKVEP